MNAPATTIPARIASMIPGTIPAGTNLPGFGRVVCASLTAYEVNTGHGLEWVPFVHVHPLRTVDPMVVFG